MHASNYINQEPFVLINKSLTITKDEIKKNDRQM